MPNLGPASSKMLERAGIKTPDELIELGPVAAYLRVKTTGDRTSLMLLYAIYGAIHNCHFAKIPVDEKAQLMMELDAALDIAKRVGG